MAIALEPVTMLQWLSGLLLLALGLWVLTLRPRRGATVLFAVFAACFGFATFLINVFAGASTPSVRQVAGLVEVPAYVALVLLVWRFPARLPAAARPGAAMAAALAAGHAALIIGLFAAAAPREWPAFCCRGAASGQSTVLNFSEPMLAAFLFALLLLPVRFRHAAPADRRGLLVMAAALLLYPGALAGDELMSAPLWSRAFGAVTIGILALVAVLWLRNAALAGRDARRVAWLGLAVPLAAMLLVPLRASGLPLSAVGLARTVSVLVLAYGILRTQLFGLDVKVKWTISRGTLAAIFIGVFFVVTQVAQNYLQQYGVLAGGVAAGLLLFAVTPLQKVAERVANVAMPGTKSVPEMSQGERASAYKQAALAAWRDGSVSRDERFMLDEMRAALGLPDDVAMRLEGEAARAPQRP